MRYRSNNQLKEKLKEKTEIEAKKLATNIIQSKKILKMRETLFSNRLKEKLLVCEIPTKQLREKEIIT